MNADVTADVSIGLNDWTRHEVSSRQGVLLLFSKIDFGLAINGNKFSAVFTAEGEFSKDEKRCLFARRLCYFSARFAK